VTLFVDVHSHVTPLHFPEAPSEPARPRWPCMQCEGGGHQLLLGDKPFRKLDARSWDIGRRLCDMDRDGVDIQLLSPMPELLSYWLERGDAAALCDWTNHQIAEMVAAAPRRFRGLGAVPLQDPGFAAEALRRLKSDFGLSGVEIGSNIDGLMLGDARLDPFWQAAEAENMPVFVHALHPVAARALPPDPIFTAIALFPIDVAMAAASLLMAGVPERYPRLRIGFSHGGGALASILGRLDTGWQHSGGFGGKLARRPSEVARELFYDSNVYAPGQLRHLCSEIAPGHVFAGTDYPYDIMQVAPAAFVRGLGLPAEAHASLCGGAASLFLGEDLASAFGS
jgi:aminocarboxymuconate-semialdehyde decarboxylase